MILLRLARRAVVYEIGTWRSLARWLRRRPDVAAGADAFPYASAVSPVLWTFVVLSAVEIPLVDLLLPWPSLRAALLVAGVYGLLWMVGLLASMTVYPHAVDGDGLRVRSGFSVDVRVPWAAIAAVRVRRRSVEGSRTVVVEEGERRAVSVTVVSSTQVDVELRTPLVLPLARTGGRPVDELRLAADDPAALVRRLRQGIADHAAAAAPDGEAR
ncbi:hypothetical protein SAMN05660690_2673 [Geodermatophilus telluris]|uniref:PH domain-containing protein n=1 Tax=Geodermatophilus telluris TaxID=1190417 RepID=A0A1G6PN04_9ACTN|nr:hypothetical protein [Geodermatophilus telluris]SDC81563.1 hypothetical protein SAMN05660690_2673 [Geodermatophilus telluris]